MARFTEIRHWCDVHMKQGEKVEATFSENVGVGSTIRLLELCEDDRAKVIGDLESVLMEFGGPTQTTQQQRGAKQTVPVVADSGRMQCPVCGNDYKNKGSLGVHARTQHNQTLGELGLAGVRGRTKRGQ